MTFSISTAHGTYKVDGDEIKVEGNFVCVCREDKCVASFLSPLSVTPDSGCSHSGEEPPYEYRYYLP